MLSVDLIGQAVSRRSRRGGREDRTDDVMKIGSVDLPSPFAIAPMAGMTDTAFRRLVKRHGGCGLVVTEMVSAEGLVRGIDRTLEYAEYTEEERPISIQIFGGDPDKMAAAAQIVEGMGADIVDVNMGCPVPKIAKHNAGCSLMREPAHAAAVIDAMAKAVRIPVTVKMRAGWNDDERNAPTLAQNGRGCRRRGGRGPRPNRGAELQRIGRLGSGGEDRRTTRDPGVRQRRLHRAASRSSSACGRAWRACWSAAASCAIRGFLRRRRISPPAARLGAVTLEDRGRFLLDYIDLLLHERVDEARALTHDRWVINKMRALGVVVHEGPRQRLALADRRQHDRFAALAARHDRGVFLRRPASLTLALYLSGLMCLAVDTPPAVCRIEPVFSSR